MKKLMAFMASALLLAASGLTPAHAVSGDQLTGVSIFGNIGTMLNSSWDVKSTINVRDDGSLGSYAPGNVCSNIVETPTFNFDCTPSAAIDQLKKNSKYSSYLVGLPECKVSSQLPCIESISLIDSEGKTYAASLIGKKTEPGNWPAVPELNLPASNSVRTYWSTNIKGVEQRYMLSASISAPLAKSYQLKNGVPVLSNAYSSLIANLIPYRTPNLAEFPDWQTPPHAAYQAAPVAVQGKACPKTSVWNDERTCALREDFVSNMKVQINFRTHSMRLGSMSGRIYSPKIELTPGKEFDILSVTGAPMKVPGVYIEDLTKAARFMNLNNSTIGAGQMSTLNNLRKFVGDTASTTRTEWSFLLSPNLNLNLQANQMARVNKCWSSAFSDSSSLGAFISSNALMSQATPPTFDGKNLTYQLSGFHKNSDGSVFSGYYQVIMDAKIARCIYNLKDKALQAKVSITDSGGAPQTAFTQTLKENPKDKKIYFEVAGFHFSDPKISVQLTN